MSDIALEGFLILLLIVANGVFSGSEIALVSVRKARLEQQARSGDRRARLALKLANAPNDFLSTVQIGITLIGILSGALGGATVAESLRQRFAQVPLLQPYSNLLSLAVVVGLITYLSLVIGELVPKRIALNQPEQIACFVARPMKQLSRLAAPLVTLLGFSTNTVVRALGIQAAPEVTITEEELRLLIEQGTEAGTFEEAEQAMVERIFRLGDRPIKSVMTPRTEIDWIDLEATLEENRLIIMNSPHSRFPVCRGNIDNCVGVVRIRSLLPNYLSGDDPSIDLESLLQPPVFVAESTRALKVLELFKESSSQFALVLDEYGGVDGLVTLNDLVTAIFGEVPTLDDAEEPMIVQREDGSWLLDGLLPIDNLMDLIDREHAIEDGEMYHTLGGFMIRHLGRIPNTGDHFEWEGLRFEIVDMDGRRIDKVLLEMLPQEQPRDEDEE